jgi:hypothetical protein
VAHLQILPALAKRFGWSPVDADLAIRRSTIQPSTSLRERRVALERKIHHLYADQLPNSAFKWSTERWPKVEVRAPHLASGCSVSELLLRTTPAHRKGLAKAALHCHAGQSRCAESEADASQA